MSFEPDFNDEELNEDKEDTMPDPTNTVEKSPGVYVRAGDYQPHELDMLWSGSRHFAKEDRSPVVFTIVGLAIGAIITSALFFLFSSKPEIKAGDDSELITPIVDETKLVPAAGDPILGPETVQLNTTKATTPTAKTAKPSVNQRPTSGGSTSAATYTVQNGDTLEQIARRHYGSGTPALIQKISRANNMTNPNALKVGQKLVIPPKNY